MGAHGTGRRTGTDRGHRRRQPPGDEVAFAASSPPNHEDMRRVCAVVTRRRDRRGCRAGGLVDRLAASSARSREPERLRPWLVSVAVNEAKQLLRKRRRRSAARGRPIDASRLARWHRPGDRHRLARPARPPSAGSTPTTGRCSPCATSRASTRPNSRSPLGISPAGTRNRLKRLCERLREELE